MNIKMDSDQCPIALDAKKNDACRAFQVDEQSSTGFQRVSEHRSSDSGCAFAGRTSGVEKTCSTDGQRKIRKKSSSLHLRKKSEIRVQSLREAEGTSRNQFLALSASSTPKDEEQSSIGVQEMSDNQSSVIFAGKMSEVQKQCLMGVQRAPEIHSPILSADVSSKVEKQFLVGAWEAPQNQSPVLSSNDAVEETDISNKMKNVSLSDRPNENESSDDAGINCTICFSNSKIKDRQLEFMPCGHGFHRTCISKWLLQKTSCPVCRCPVKKDRKTSKQRQTRVEESGRSITFGFQQADGRFLEFRETGTVRISFNLSVVFE